MEKIQEMMNNQLSDEELEQVGGGVNMFDVVKAKFFDSEDEVKAQNLLMQDGDKNGNVGISTLEMRVDPKKKKDSRVIRL